MLEGRARPLAPRRVFYGRLLRSSVVALELLAVCLGIGVVGYHWLAGLHWLDALVNASMILAGMGPVDPVTTTGGKWFASLYAIFSGVMFLTSVGVMMAPAVHRPVPP